MAKKIYKKWVWAAGALMMCSCLDLGLLDDMVLMDTDSTQAEPAASDTGGDERRGPPATDASDTEAPTLLRAACGDSVEVSDGICAVLGPVSASIHFSTDEPATVSVSGADGISIGVISLEWEIAHFAVVAGLVSDTACDVTISVSDVNGNTDSHVVSLTGADGPSVVITEVLADPFGPEPAQEFVEVANQRDESVDISGWMVDDNNDSNGDVIPEGTVLAPKMVALLVGAGFDPMSPDDPMPDVAARIVYLENSLVSNGLKNGQAESLELYDAQGALMSRYTGQAGAPIEGLSVHRRLVEIPPGDSEAYFEEPVDATPGSVPALP